MDGMYLTEEIKGSISILLVLWMECTLQRRLKVVIEILPLISSVEYIPSIRPAV
jgi:hypothetical protein